MQKEEERRRRALKEVTKERTVTSETSTTTTTTVHRAASNGGPQVGMNGGVNSIAETVKNTVLGFLSPSSKDKSLPYIVESAESGFEEGNIIGGKGEKRGSNVRFRPARDFFDEADRRERFTSDYFSGSDTPSKLRESTRRLSIRKPYNAYIAYSSDEEFDDWKEQPKSDYTYSASLTYRSRVTPDRMIGSPNMSRRTLKGGNIGFVGSPDFNSSEEASFNAHRLRSRTIVKPMDALSDASDGEEIVVQETQPRSRRSSRRSTRSPSYELPKSNGSLTRTITTTSTEFLTTKTLHLGLDADSDVDDGTESAVLVRAVPLLARGGTPLGRATTPLPTLKISSSRRSSSATLDTAGRGYTVGEGTIAEDVEEEEDEEALGDVFTRWTRKTVHTVTQMTTIVTAFIAMTAARAVTASSTFIASSTATASSKSKLDMEEKSSISTMGWLRSKGNAARDHLRKNPILLWIPLLLLLLLLALAAYWWLLQSHGNTAGASDPTENDGPSFPFALVALVSKIGSWLYSGVTSVVATTWGTTTNSLLWLMTAIQGGCAYAFLSFLAMCNWLGATTLTCLMWLWSWTVFCYASLLDFLYLAWVYMQSCGLSVYNFSSSSAAYMYSFLPFVSSNDSRHDEIAGRKESFSVYAWVSNLSPVESVSKAYVGVAELVQSSGNMLWNAWMWLVLGMGDLISLVASFLLWVLSSILAAILYVLTGLWTALTYCWVSLVTILGTVASTVLSIAPNKSSTVSVTTEKLIVQPTVGNVLSYEKIEDIVQKVLDSEQLKGYITAAMAGNSKLLVEEELKLVKDDVKLVKDDVSGLRKEMLTNSAASTEQYTKIIHLQEDKTNLIKELGMLGQRLYNVEGKLEVADVKSLEDQRELEEKIKKLVQQFSNLEVDHANLAADIKSCCDDKKVPALLGEIFGLTSNGTSDGEQPDIGAWLKNYFVAKEELDIKLNDLIATMQVKPDDEAAQAAVSQTSDMVMGAVLLKLQEEMRKQQAQYSEDAQLQMSAQVNSQVKAAAGILGEQVSEQVAQQVQVQNQQLKATMQENINGAVQERVRSAVEIAVSKAVEAAVNIAVTEAVGKSVPDTVKDILPGMVSVELEAVVPEVVSSILPSLVHVSDNQAGDEVSEEIRNEVKNEIVGVTASANITREGGDGTLFVPGMHLTAGLNKTEVLKIVTDALRKYDADKTGMVDHALETAGGNIVSTRCTESYQVHQAEVRVLGFPIYRYSTNNPRTIIQPDTMPGQCWAFKGSQGYIVIQLAGPVQPTGFTLEHIPKSLSPNGAIDSAPHEFEVWGLNSVDDEGTHLGEFEYDEHGEPLQYFEVKEENYFHLIELKINSNYGNLQYTCLYRFRVHGVRELL